MRVVLRLWLFWHWLRSAHVGTYPVRAHVHLAGPNPQKELPAHGITSVNAIEKRRLRIEREVASNTQGDFVRIPDVAYAAKGICADAEGRMSLLDSEQRAICRTQQFILVHEFQPSVEVVLIEKVNRGFRGVSVQVCILTTQVIPPPPKRRRPIAMIEWLVVLHRGRRPADVRSWL